MYVSLQCNFGTPSTKNWIRFSCFFNLCQFIDLLWLVNCGRTDVQVLEPRPQGVLKISSSPCWNCGTIMWGNQVSFLGDERLHRERGSANSQHQPQTCGWGHLVPSASNQMPVVTWRTLNENSRITIQLNPVWLATLHNCYQINSHCFEFLAYGVVCFTEAENECKD